VPLRGIRVEDAAAAGEVGHAFEATPRSLRPRAPRPA
jgi:hypothetical protein